MSGASLVLLLLESLHATVFDSPSLVCVWLEKKFNGVIPVAPHCNEAGCMGTHKSCMFYVQLANILASYIHKHSHSLALEVCPQSETNFTNDDNDGITNHEETKTILFVCLKSTIFLGVEGKRIYLFFSSSSIKFKLTGIAWGGLVTKN